jgi:hypothetical protein
MFFVRETCSRQKKFPSVLSKFRYWHFKLFDSPPLYTYVLRARKFTGRLRINDSCPNSAFTSKPMYSSNNISSEAMRL